MKDHPVGSLQSRVERLERCLGSLLIFLAAQDIIGEEDFAILESVRRPGAPQTVPTATVDGLQPETPF